MFFAAISGSGPATVAAIGTLTIPAMTERGYDRLFAAAVVASAGAIDVMIPPSNPFVVYGVAGQASVGKLFLAGITPGIFTGLALMLVAYCIDKKKGWRAAPRERTLKTFGKAVWTAKGALLVPIVVRGGIYGGIMTPTEAAAFAALYGLLVAFRLPGTDVALPVDQLRRIRPHFGDHHKVGVAPIHFGVIMVVHLAIGFVTPPVGVNLFVDSGITNVKIEQVSRAALLFLTAMLTVLAFVTFLTKAAVTSEGSVSAVASPRKTGRWPNGWDACLGKDKSSARLLPSPAFQAELEAGAFPTLPKIGLNQAIRPFCFYDFSQLKERATETDNHPLCAWRQVLYTKKPLSRTRKLFKLSVEPKGKVFFMGTKIQSLAHTKWLCKYHIVFTPK